MTLSLDLNDPHLIEDPYPIYSAFQQKRPVFFAQFGGERVLVVTKFDDVAVILNDRETRVNRPGTTVPEIFAGSASESLWENSISRMDPPAHTQVRRTAGSHFSQKNVSRFKVIVDEVTAEVFDEITTKKIEVVKSISNEIPMRVICRLLGIPIQDGRQLLNVTNSFLKIFLPINASRITAEEINGASRTFIDYFQKCVKSSSDRNRDDLISQLTFGPLQNGDISLAQLVGLLRGLFTAGYETTAAGISASFHAFASYQEQFQLLREDTSLIANAAEEILRWETPVQAILRYSAREVYLSDAMVSPGQAVLLLTGASNRDPARYTNPQNIDIRREVGDHHAFGGGRHFCLGRSLAKLEMEAVFREMTERYSQFRQPSNLSRRQNLQFRSITYLPIELTGH